MVFGFHVSSELSIPLPFAPYFNFHLLVIVHILMVNINVKEHIWTLDCLFINQHNLQSFFKLSLLFMTPRKQKGKN